jgi:hypothetical protein
MVNTDMVNAKSRVPDTPIFVKIFPFCPCFCTSKTPLNIVEYLMLTKSSAVVLAASAIFFRYFNSIDVYAY